VFVLLFVVAASGACRTAERPLPASSPREALARADASVAPPVADRGASADAGASETDAGGASAYVRYDVNHVLITGQSLSVGVSGAPPLSTSQPFHNLMFNTGVMAGGEDLESFEPLVEGDFIPGSKAVVETMSSAFANLVTELSLAGGDPSARHDLLVSVHGSGAKQYARLKKGTKPYENGMAQVVAGRDIARRMGKTYVVRAIATVHGESDHAEQNDHYDDDLLEWQADYERDIKAITGQSEPVPMFQTQISSWTRMMKGTETSAVPIAQLSAHRKSNGKVVLVGPKYHLSYSKDGVHLTARGYRHMGEDYAKAYRRVVLEGRPWEPLRPIATRREGAVITITFAVPVPPIVLDTTLVSDPGNYGFEYTDDSASPPSITRVEVTGPDTVAITLSAEPTGQNRRIRYAFTGIRGAPAGPTSGPRGNLRDSDDTRSRTGNRLYNWCVHFDEPVP